MARITSGLWMRCAPKKHQTALTATTWTVTRHDGPNHLRIVMRCAPKKHQTALIVSGLCALQPGRGTVAEGRRRRPSTSSRSTRRSRPRSRCGATAWQLQSLWAIPTAAVQLQSLWAIPTAAVQSLLLYFKYLFCLSVYPLLYLYSASYPVLCVLSLYLQLQSLRAIHAYSCTAAIPLSNPCCSCKLTRAALAALKAAMSRTVTLIQGPPGAGATNARMQQIRTALQHDGPKNLECCCPCAQLCTKSSLPSLTLLAPDECCLPPVANVDCPAT